MSPRILFARGAFLLGLAPLFASATVPSARLERLTRGVNLSHWFSQIPEGGYRHEWFSTYNTATDFALIAGAGFRHVRFPVEFEMFWEEAGNDGLRSEFLGDFDRALDQLIEAGLAVIVDWHAREDTKVRLATDDGFAERAIDWWEAMARHLAGRDPERVFFEVLNEPAGGMSSERWSALQERFVAAIRAVAPHHTIIVAGHRWSGLDELRQLAPLADGNLVYNFHFYEPMVFTHQTAHWPEMGLEPVTGLAYPADEASKAANLERMGDGEGRRHVLEYAADRAWLAARLRLAADWAAQHGVPVTCNEFGVYIPAAPTADRYRWLRDARELCEELGLGWTMWDYAGGFAVAQGDPAAGRELDQRCLEALGLAEAGR